MCGIVGYIGGGEALPFLLGGLKRLEYRGYDSSGIALLANGSIEVHKKAGRISVLEEGLSYISAASCAGIGHTRWATHGSPTDLNAHPHKDCSGSIVVVHNGIIENYAKIKEKLRGKNHRFISETDTEVIPHLIEDILRRTSLSFEEAALEAISNLEGSYALAVLNKDDPDTIICAKRHSPLVIGLGTGQVFVASDTTALTSACEKVIYLEDGDMAVVRKDGVRIIDKHRKEAERQHAAVSIKDDAASMGAYETFMLKEIHEQPVVLERLLHDNVRNSLFCRTEADPLLKSITRIFILGCGTAYHAGLIGKYLFEHFTNIPVEIDIASEFRYRRPKLNASNLILAISQSGETADTIASIRAAKEKGCPVISICNVEKSTIARESAFDLHINAGPEIGVASTKAYTAQVLMLQLLAIHVARLRGEIDGSTAKRFMNELFTVPGKISSILQTAPIIEETACVNHEATSALYLGRSFNYPTALEGALKNKEISYMHAEGHAAGEMKHGPIALIDSSLPVVCVCPKGETYDKMISNIKEVEARKGRIISVATKGDKLLPSFSSSVFFVPDTWEEISPLLAVVPLQLFAYHIAKRKGCDIDKPRNLAKSVTVE